MYSRSFFDLDGHVDGPGGGGAGPEAFAASVQGGEAPA
jgi:hypothetical protein